MSTSLVPGERPDRMEEECAVFGVYAPGEDVARLTCFGLQALQHRGQESAGIAVGDGETVLELRVAPEDMGKVIGRQGRIAKEIRTLMRSVAQRKGTRVSVEIVD